MLYVAQKVAGSDLFQPRSHFQKHFHGCTLRKKTDCNILHYNLYNWLKLLLYYVCDCGRDTVVSLVLNRFIGTISAHLS